MVDCWRLGDGKTRGIAVAVSTTGEKTYFPPKDETVRLSVVECWFRVGEGSKIGPRFGVVRAEWAFLNFDDDRFMLMKLKP